MVLKEECRNWSREDEGLGRLGVTFVSLNPLRMVERENILQVATWNGDSCLLLPSDEGKL
jgi:hypothetical protein